MKKKLQAALASALSSLVLTSCEMVGDRNREISASAITRSVNKCDDTLSTKKWKVEAGARVELVKSRNEGAFAALHLPKYAPGAGEWPLMQLRVENGLPEDWSDYDALRLDCRKKTPLLVSLGIFIGDRDKGKAFIKPALDRETWQTVQLTLTNQKIDLKKINRLRIYVTRPGADMEIDVRNVRLVSFISLKLARMSKAFRSFGDVKTAERILPILSALNKGELSLKEGKRVVAKLKKEIRTTQMGYLRKKFRELHPGATFTVGFADSMERVLPRYGTPDLKPPSEWRISLAKNEYEAFQAVVIPPEGKGLKNLVVTVSCDNKQLEKCLQAAPVGFVKTKHPVYSVEHIGWYPDPILEFANRINVKAGDIQPFWIRAHAPDEMTAGIYKCRLNISASGEPTVQIPFNVEIFNFTIPRKGHLRTAISLYGSKLLKHGPQMYKAYDFVLEKYRLNPFSIYSDSAYGAPKLHPVSEYEKRVKLGLNAIPVVYLKLPRQALHSGTTNSKARWNALPASEKLKYPEKEAENVMRVLAKRIPELKKAGLYEMAYCYGMDEATTSEWPACVDLCHRIKRKYPDIKIYSTAYDQSYGTQTELGDALDGWIPSVGLYNFKLAEKVRKQGKEVWWYGTRMCIDDKPLWTIRSLMGEKAFKNKVDGYLYWTITRWGDSNDTPIVDAPYTKWNPMTHPGMNGGGSFLCMGPNNMILPTIRLENIRDGLEDYEYFYKLKAFVEKTSSAKRGREWRKANAILEAKAVDGISAIRAERRKIAKIISEGE